MKVQLTKKEVRRLYELTDVMTTRCPQLWIDDFCKQSDNKLFDAVSKKLKNALLEQ